MNHPLHCLCGTIRGYVVRPGPATRAVCYCKDCQAFARFLKRAELILDEHSGTHIVATVTRNVYLNQGLKALTCMSLSEKGMLRWYGSCCNTPIGNTPRDFRTPYVGLVESCLQSDAPSIEESFGPVRMVLSPRKAKGKVTATPFGNLVPLAGIMKAVIGARLRGALKDNPFFDDKGNPVASPRTLTPAERAQFTP
jgi:hypothetical protein